MREAIPGAGERSGSRAWALVFRAMFRMTPVAALRFISEHVPDGPLREVVIVGRRSGIERRIMLAVLNVNGMRYVGHPNGRSAQWARNLLAAGEAIVTERDGSETEVVATVLGPGAERDAVIQVAMRQPFPGGALYRAAHSHVSESALYFRLEPRANR